jgi:hypothetical protein
MPGKRPQVVTDQIEAIKALLATLTPGQTISAEQHQQLTDVVSALEGDNIVWGS